MQYLEIGLITLPVVFGLSYLLRDLRQVRDRSVSKTALKNIKNNWAEEISESTASGVDFGRSDPAIEAMAGEAAHTVVVDVGQAIEQMGHWLHH